MALSAESSIRQRTGEAVKKPVDAATARKDGAQMGKTWGRARDVGTINIIICGAIMAFCPLFVVYAWMSCTSFQCSLMGPLEKVFKADSIESGIRTLVHDDFPKPTSEGFKLYFAWLAFQAVCYSWLPGKIGYGQMTPAGYTLPYIVNGLLTWIVTHALFFGASLGLGLFPASIIHDNWGGLLIATNVYGYLLTGFCYLKAQIAPSHREDRKFSGSIIYDLYMGIEFNPRFGKYFDFKLFHNGRPGIVAWTLIDMSFAAAQYQRIGYVTNSMILLNLLHLTYVIDFFINEDWYLRTIDIAHDHFGFYLSWGDTVWLPFMYTLQSHYLVRNPVDMTWPWFTFVFVLGASGYYIFRAVNHQKDIVRRTDGTCNIWGRPAKVIRTEFVTSDGKVHKSLLLCSGFWGLSRHFNYVGDLLISSAMCLTCGFEHLLPYFYIIFMTILLLQRVARDQERCKGKYGAYWEEYCRAVPYKLIPYVY
ncbi:ergosterol biosynthesis ERG4/ERG24 [Powellomyces hirtus]|nr:ergosterol biosynthesis ERG4/ERG24 [Powellomyces hirtus]